MKSFLFILAACCISINALAHPSFTLTNNQTGLQYLCTQGGNQPPQDDDCIPNLSDFCNSNTAETRHWCFTITSAYCKGKTTQYKTCVRKVASYCFENTAERNRWCYEQALQSCSGQSVVALLKAVKWAARLKRPAKEADVNQVNEF